MTQESIDLSNNAEIAVRDDYEKFLSMKTAGQLFGMPVTKIEDILLPQEITPIPLSPPEVMGSLNLRGRIVTAIDLRVRLGLGKLDYINNSNYRCVVIDYRDVLYSLIVDSVSEVINIYPDEIRRSPENLSPDWKEVCKGVFPMDDDLMVIVSVERLLSFVDSSSDLDDAVIDNID